MRELVSAGVAVLEGITVSAQHGLLVAAVPLIVAVLVRDSDAELDTVSDCGDVPRAVPEGALALHSTNPAVSFA